MIDFDRMIRIYENAINNYYYTFFDIIYMLIREEIVVPPDVQEWVKSSDGWKK